MKTHKSFRIILLNIAVALFMVAIITAVIQKGSQAQAQNLSSQTVAAPIDPNSAQAVTNKAVLVEKDLPITPLGDGGDGLPEGVTPEPASVVPSGLEEADAIQVSFSYHRLLGTDFNPRTSTTTFAYNFNGCIYENGGTDNRFMAPLLIPTNSVIKYLRLYYDDTNAAGDITAWITRYQPGVTSEDLTTVNSSGSSGYGTTLSSEITHTVDLANWAYSIIIAPNANSSTNSFCGVRVAYYAPNAYAVAVPVILK